MKRPSNLVLLGIALLMLLAFDIGISIVVLPRYWRPLPPFGAITSETQEAWLAEQRAAGDADQETGIGRFDRRLGWSYRPKTVGGDGMYHINSRGWRSAREYPREAAPGTRRIVACGDSYTFCQEVADDEAWPAVLESMVPRSEVINLGVGGFGTGQAFLRFQEEDLGERIDVVLIGILLENIGRNVNRYRPRWFTSAARPVAKPRYVYENGGLRLVEQPFATRAELLDAVQGGYVRDRLAADEYWDDTGVPGILGWSGISRMIGARLYYGRRDLATLWTDTDGEPFRTTVAVLEAFHRHAIDERGARFAPVLVFPTMEDLAGYVDRDQHYWTTLVDALEAKGVDCIDLAEPLGEAWEARREGGAPVYTGTHLSPAGNVVVAVSVQEWLAAQERAPKQED